MAAILPFTNAHAYHWEKQNDIGRGGGGGISKPLGTVLIDLSLQWRPSCPSLMLTPTTAWEKQNDIGEVRGLHNFCTVQVGAERGSLSYYLYMGVGGGYITSVEDPFIPAEDVKTTVQAGADTGSLSHSL